MEKFKAFLSSAWDVTKRVAVPVLRVVGIVFAGSKVGKVAVTAAPVVEAVVEAVEDSKK